MTPKEKAKEIFDKMYGKTPVRDDENLIELDRDRDTARQCALIAVDELLDAFHQMGMYRECAYWQQVGQEIENL